MTEYKEHYRASSMETFQVQNNKKLWENANETKFLSHKSALVYHQDIMTPSFPYLCNSFAHNSNVLTK